MALGQPGIYNILDYGAVTGGSPTNYTRAQNNVTAIQTAISDAISGCVSGTFYGGIILIPSNDLSGDGGIYYLSQTAGGTGPLFSITCPFPLLFLGTSPASRLYMSPSSMSKNIDNDVAMFQVDNATTDDTEVGGISFQDLTFEYDTSLTGSTDYAVASLGSQNVRLFRCVLIDVPGGVNIKNTLQFTMIDCTGLFSSTMSGTMVTIGDTGSAGTGSVDAYVAGCNFRVGEGTGSGTTIGLSLGICDQLKVVDTHFDGFQTGIKFNPSADTIELSFTNVLAHGPGTQILMTPLVGNKIQSVCFTNCDFLNNLPTSSASAVILDATTHNSNIDGVRFISCVCSNNPAAGMEIRSGQHIEIIWGSLLR